MRYRNKTFSTLLPRVMSPVRYIATVTGALAIAALSWSGVHSQIVNPGVQAGSPAVIGDCVKYGPGVAQITTTGAPCAAPVVVTPSPLTKADDTNVTLTLSGTPATALLQAVEIQAGWTGTLAAARLNSNVVQGFTSADIVNSIAAQNATLALGAFTGDVTKTQGSLATTVSKFSGNVLPTTAGADNQILIGSGASNFIFSTIPNCTGGAIQYTAATHLFSCSATLTSGTVTSVSITAGTGITQSGSPVTGSGAITVNVDKATAANLEAGTSNKVLTSDIIFDAETTITFSATQTLDFNTFLNARITATANTTSLTCSNIKASQSGVITWVQDATGSRTMVAGWCSQFRWTGGVRGVLSTAANAIDALFYQCISSSICYVSLGKAQAN